MDKPQVIAFMVGGEIADDDPHKWIKLRALAISDAAEAWEDAARPVIVEARADAIDQAAELLMDDAFDVESTWDAAEAAGLPDGMIDSAGNAALLLWQVERGL